MNNSYIFDLDLIDDFKDEFLHVMDTMERDILSIQDDAHYQDNVDKVFRTFHSLKAHASYVNAEEMRKVFSVIEDVLHILRNKKPPVKQEIIDWLLLVNDHMHEWIPDIEKNNFDILPMDSFILNMIKISTISTARSAKITKSLTVLLIEDGEKYSNKIKLTIEKTFRKVYTTTFDNALEDGKNLNCDMILIITALDDHSGLKVIKELKDEILRKPYLLIATSKPSKEVYLSLQKLNMDSVSPISIKKKDLLSRLKNIAESNYGTSWISLDDKLIKDTISNLAPLPETIVKLQKIVLQEETTPRDISNLISSDPFLMGKVLKVINAPIFALKNEVTNIQNAVSLLGKERICAIAMQESVVGIFTIPTLSPYGISQDDFFDIARKRMELMTAWYSKVSFNKLTILSTTALLGSIGQILLAEKISRERLGKEFLLLNDSTNSKVAESEILNITTEETTAKILTHWGMNSTLVDSIKYSFNLTNAPSEVKSLAIANYVVYSTVESAKSSESNTERTIEDMCEFLQEMNLEADSFRSACKKVFQLD